jgi:exoribonuclease R
MVQFTKSMEKISNADSTRAGRPCHDVGFASDSLFTHFTSPGGAA